MLAYNVCPTNRDSTSCWMVEYCCTFYFIGTRLSVWMRCVSSPPQAISLASNSKGLYHSTSSLCWWLAIGDLFTSTVSACSTVCPSRRVICAVVKLMSQTRGTVFVSITLMPTILMPRGPPPLTIISLVGLGEPDTQTSINF